MSTGIHKKESVDVSSGDDSSRAGARRTQTLSRNGPVLNEQSLRRFVALEAKALGHGGVSLMSASADWRGRRFITDFLTFATTWRFRLDVSVRRAAGERRRRPGIQPSRRISGAGSNR